MVKTWTFFTKCTSWCFNTPINVLLFISTKTFINSPHNNCYIATHVVTHKTTKKTTAARSLILQSLLNYLPHIVDGWWLYHLVTHVSKCQVRFFHMRAITRKTLSVQFISNGCRPLIIRCFAFVVRQAITLIRIIISLHGIYCVVVYSVE